MVNYWVERRVPGFLTGIQQTQEDAVWVKPPVQNTATARYTIPYYRPRNGIPLLLNETYSEIIGFVVMAPIWNIFRKWPPALLIVEHKKKTFERNLTDISDIPNYNRKLIPQLLTAARSPLAPREAPALTWYHLKWYITASPPPPLFVLDLSLAPSKNASSGSAPTYEKIYKLFET